MTDEEKKAIENVKKQLEGIKKANECGLATKNEFKEDIESIETVLNLIQKQQAELEKKDKIIGRIYDFIWENDCCRYFSKKHAMCNQVLNFDSCLGNCKRHCINKYFEKRVEGN